MVVVKHVRNKEPLGVQFPKGSCEWCWRVASKKRMSFFSEDDFTVLDKCKTSLLCRRSCR